ncbi:MAG: PD-(D/E)XK nuclease family protein [Candidatus Hydrogenedentes bacterium]|nr:PD-(D/E)XK nuclease family protein [Candidatus Hydrogenedentota bacterium]
MKPAIHQSQLDMLTGKCAIMYEHRYINNIKVPPGIAVHAGTGVHQGAAKNYEHTIEHGTLLDTEAVVEIAVSAFDAALEKDGAIDDSPSERGDAKDKTVRLARLHAERVAPARMPAAVEKSFRLELGNYPIDVVGTIDLIEKNDELSDVKTSGKSPQESIVHSSVQLSAYALAKNAMDGKPLNTEVAVRLDYLVDTKLPKHVPLHSSRNGIDYQNFLKRVELANQMIESGVFPPTSPGNWVCSAKWCGYYNDICAFGRRGRSHNTEGN